MLDFSITKDRDSMNVKALNDRDAVGSSIGQITVVIVCLQHID